MTTTKKMTKRDYFHILRDSYPTTADNYDSVMAFIDHELELLDKKNLSSQNADRKPTKAMLENDDVRAQILAWMKPDTLYAIPDFIKECPACEGMASQRLSGLFRKLYDKDFPENPESKVIRIEDKRKTYFKLNPNYQG